MVRKRDSRMFLCVARVTFGPNAKLISNAFLSLFLSIHWSSKTHVEELCLLRLLNVVYYHNVGKQISYLVVMNRIVRDRDSQSTALEKIYEADIDNKYPGMPVTSLWRWDRLIPKRNFFH